MVVGYLIVAMLGAAVAAFALQNPEPVRIRFLVWSLESVPAAGIVLASFAVGVVLAGVPLWLARWRLRARVRMVEARLASLERDRAAVAPPAAPPPGERAAS